MGTWWHMTSWHGSWQHAIRMPRGRGKMRLSVNGSAPVPAWDVESGPVMTCRLLQNTAGDSGCNMTAWSQNHPHLQNSFIARMKRFSGPLVCVGHGVLWPFCGCVKRIMSKAIPASNEETPPEGAFCWNLPVLVVSVGHQICDLKTSG